MKSLVLGLLVIAAALSEPKIAIFAQVIDPMRDSENIGTPAQQPSSASNGISGMVLDPSGAAISNAQIALLAADGKPVAQVTTDTDTLGAFHLDNVPLGVYSLDVQSVGFRETHVGVSVGRRQSSVCVVMGIAVQQETVNVGSSDTAPMSLLSWD